MARRHVDVRPDPRGAGRAFAALFCLVVALALFMPLSGCCVVGETLGEAVSGSDEGADSTAPAESAAPDDSSQQFALRDFEAQTLDGATFTQDDLAGYDLTIVNFWGVTCGPCIDEMPDIAEYAASLPDNIQLVTVCIDAQVDPEYAREVLADAGFQGVTLVSGDGDYASCMRNLRYTPTTVVLDSQGNQLTEPLIGSPIDLASAYDVLVKSARSQQAQQG